MTEQSHRFLDAHFEQHRETLIRVELCYWLIAPNDICTTSVNITEDPGESNNLAAKHPEKLDSMRLQPIEPWRQFALPGVWPVL